MIPIALETSFEIFVIFSMIAVAGLWAYQVWHTSYHHWSISEEKLCRCKECSLTYIVERSESVSRCPRCNQVNNVNLKTKI